MPKTKVKTYTPRIPLFIHEAVASYAKDHGCTLVHAYETIVTLGLQRVKSFEEMLNAK